MPELAEVERSRKLLEQVALGKTIKSVRTKQDEIVYVGNAREQMDTLVGRKVLAVKRKGKQFYMLLDGSGPQPIFHKGMSGSTAIKDGEQVEYRKKPKKKLNEEGTDWPPAYWRCEICFDDESRWAFTDSRRLGRIKMIEDPDIEAVPPLSLLGADPYLNMISQETLKELLSHRKAPIKAILLDQNAIFCGLGNWLVDEILYHAKIHPSQPCNSLTEEMVKTLHEQITYVVNEAVRADADSSKFPSHWLFKHRWGKGRGGKGKQKSFVMASGEETQVIYETVGGRTSAICLAVQKLDKTIIPVTPTKRKPRKAVEVIATTTEITVADSVSSPAKLGKRKRRQASPNEDDSDLTPVSDDGGPD